MSRSTASAPTKFDVRTRGVEVCIVRDYVTLLARHTKEDPLCRAALVGGNHVLVTCNILDGVAESIKTAAARIALVALHNRGPLMHRHCAGARVSEEIDENVIGGQEEKIVVRGFNNSSRCARVVQRIGSTLLMRNGSITVLIGMLRPHLRATDAPL